MALTRAELDAKAKQPLPIKRLDVPDFGEVYIRKMRGFERDRWEASRLGNGRGGRNLENFRASLVCVCLCDEAGQRLYQDEEVPLVGAWDAVPLDFVYDECERLNVLKKEDVEKLAGNSGSGQSAASGSNSATDTAAPSENSKPT